jgi:hypothetical protein
MGCSSISFPFSVVGPVREARTKMFVFEMLIPTHFSPDLVRDKEKTRMVYSSLDLNDGCSSYSLNLIKSSVAPRPILCGKMVAL